MSVFVVDTNFFIQAHRVSYPLDVAISFWNKIKQLAGKGTIISIDKVKGEIFNNDDELKQWCEENLPEDFFKDSSEVLVEYGEVVTWAYSMRTQYTESALSEFLDADEADAFLVSYALAYKSERIIVTQEKSQPEIKRKIKIPEACTPFNIEYVDTIEMLRRLGERF